MGRYGSLNYPLLTKGGFGLGVAMFVVGAIGATMVHGPSTAHTLLVDMEALGILVGLFSPFVFGILLPLTE
ncbi:hypothetical protein ACFPYI_09365 [Halomarina salina]|uniref:Major facilitator superfamily (MFS) profile domain-containing protein n=1 Tax=Halomarina salina TaxID=1872699 RepID=A0ABD5RLT8_9EURY|nr:hypothetical protein [Halomarina salina]